MGMVIIKTYVVGDGIVDSKLLSEPLGQRLETSAQDGHLVAQNLQCTAELSGAGGDGDNGLELVKHVRGDSLEKAHALLQGCGEVQLAVHGTLGDFLTS